MSDGDLLQSLEGRAYAAAYSDGILDLFVGLSLIWIGSIWIFLPDYGGLAGILPAVATPLVVAARKKFVQNRIGYVRWSEPRRTKERRSLVTVFVVGVLLFLTGIAAYLMFDRAVAGEDVVDWMAPAILAWILTLLTSLLAFAMDSWRFLIYAAVLGAAGLAAAMLSSNPGMPLVAGGITAATTGAILLVRFIRLNDEPESA